MIKKRVNRVRDIQGINIKRLFRMIKKKRRKRKLKSVVKKKKEYQNKTITKFICFYFLIKYEFCFCQMTPNVLYIIIDII